MSVLSTEGTLRDARRVDGNNARIAPKKTRDYFCPGSARQQRFPCAAWQRRVADARNVGTATVRGAWRMWRIAFAAALDHGDRLQGARDGVGGSGCSDRKMGALIAF